MRYSASQATVSPKTHQNPELGRVTYRAVLRAAALSSLTGDASGPAVSVSGGRHGEVQRQRTR